jgi:hypothetical protein
MNKTKNKSWRKHLKAKKKLKEKLQAQAKTAK